MHIIAEGLTSIMQAHSDSSAQHRRKVVDMDVLDLGGMSAHLTYSLLTDRIKSDGVLDKPPT